MTVSRQTVAPRIAAIAVATGLLANYLPQALAADPVSLPVLDSGFDQSGRFEVRFESEPAVYYELRRLGQLQSQRSIGMQLGTGEAVLLRDPVLPLQDTFYQVVASPLDGVQLRDADADGIPDVEELAGFPLMNPLNGATSIDPEDGAIVIPSRSEYERLARRDDVPGARDVREVKFLIFGIDTNYPSLYFFQTNHHIYHFYFARDVLNYTADMELVLVEGETTSDLPSSGRNKVIIGNLDGMLHFRVFDAQGRRIDDLREDQVRSSKDSLVAAMKKDLEPYWETGVPPGALQTEFILDLNVIIENFLLTPFNAETYFSNTQRRNLAGSLIAHDSYVGTSGREGAYTMEFWPTDPVEFEFVEKAYHLISINTPFIDSQLVYHPASETQRTLYQREKDDYDDSFVRTISTQELFGNVTYTAMNEGVGYGLLRVANAGDTLTARDLVIFRSLPNDLTHVAGIITEIPQTPLSHVNLKAIQNNTPNAYIKDASVDERIAPLIGRYVRYEVTADGYDLREATQEEVEAFLEELRPDEVQYPERDLNATEIAPLADLHLEDSISHGAKVANMAELRRMLDDERTPDGFGVPFYFYDAFMKANGFYDVASQMMADESFQNDPAVREDRLKDFRRTIKGGVAPTWMLDAIQNLHDSFPDGTPLRCRSSTNNEDLEDFNGAGLYESYTHHLDEGHLIKSMRQVWAGLWTYRAFEEREFYRIDHFTAAMGVLVHPNFENEQANGVAVTKNIVNPSWPGIYVNVQVGEDLVTNPEDESIPEEFLIAQLNPDDWGAYEIQYVRFSNRVGEGETILTTEQAEQLARELDIVQWRFRSLYKAPSSFAMEVEFKITEEGTLVIKQARPWLE